MKQEEFSILLVEDNPDDAEVVVDALGAGERDQRRFLVERAEGLNPALTRLSRGGVEAVLLDLHLPDSRGIGTFSAVAEAYPDLPVVILSGNGDEALALAAVELGAEDYLVKGRLGAEALSRALHYAIRRRRVLRDMRAVLEVAPDGMLVADAEGLVRYANPAALIVLGRTPASVQGAALGTLLPAVARGEARFKDADHGDRLVVVRSEAIAWRERPASLVLLRDVTAERKLEAMRAEARERRQEEEVRRDLQTAVSHELRTPLTVVTAALHELCRGLPESTPPDLAEAARIAYRNTRRLTRSVMAVLDLSRLEAGCGRVDARPVDAIPLVEQAVQGLRFLTADTDIVIETDLPAGLPRVVADEDLFLELLDNLVDNALRFARHRVAVSARVGEDGVVFTVADDGPGLSAEDAGKLFSRFTQLSRTGPPGRYKGTGLGLALCKEIVERLKGRIWAGTAEGGGGAFRFLLPTVGAAAHAAPEAGR